MQRLATLQKRESVKELVEFAQSLGEVKKVIHAAGVSPAMNVTPESVLRINALGTVYVNQEFAKVIKRGVIVDIASNSAYMLPKFMINKKIYSIVEQDEDLFLTKMLKKCKLAKDDYGKAGLAYAYSKNFAVWYSQYCAFKYGTQGIRVVSLSPGLIATGMGNLEKEHGGGIIPFTAEERMGTPTELGFAIASLADERNGYLAGVDILCDGGGTHGQTIFKKKK